MTWSAELRAKHRRSPTAHRRYMREYMRERYKLLSAVGLCARCGATEARSGKRECVACARDTVRRQKGKNV